MKKRVIAALCLTLTAALAMADTAEVLGKRLIRVTLAPTYMFASKRWDADGDSLSLDTAKTSGLNFGLAAEYGVTDWFTVAVQWAPGVMFASKLGDGDMNVDGAVGDLLLGAKFQIVGEKSPVKSQKLRFAVAPGVVIPMPAADLTSADVATGDKPGANIDKHAFGLGVILDFDYVFNPTFYLNAHTKFIGHLTKPELKTTEYVQMMRAAPYPAGDSPVAFGYTWDWEVEPVYRSMVGKGLLEAGLPLQLTLTPDVKIDGTKIPDSASYVFGFMPRVSYFFLNWKLPTQFELRYKFGVAGKSAVNKNSVTLAAKLFAKV
jgi:hypothetical protein